MPRTRISVLIGLIAALASSTIFACAGQSDDGDSSSADVTTGASAALTGQVTSNAEGPMGGVLVTAKAVGSTIAVTVVTDTSGQYRFPANRLQAGLQAISIRALGYELASPAKVQVRAADVAKLDLELQPVADVSTQITNAEWLASFPNLAPQKSAVERCVVCHSLERIANSKLGVDDFTKIVARDNALALNSKDGREVPLPVAPTAPPDPALVSYLTTINVSSGKRSYDLKRFPRPTGKGTNVIITEYDLPRPLNMPHDVIVDSSGTPWFDNFTENNFGKLNPATGQVTEFDVPVIKPNAPTGALSLRFGEDDAMWLGMYYQAGIARIDPKTGSVQTFSLPPELNNAKSQINMTAANHSHVDGKVWVQDAGIVGVRRLDLATGQWDTWTPFQNVPGNHNLYDVISDSKNNAYFLDLGTNFYGRIDAQTKEVKLFQTPAPNTGPRRGMMDEQDRLWFGEFNGNAIGLFDTKTESLKEFPMPPGARPYDVSLDKNGNAWTGSMMSDRVERLNPTTGEITEYLLPKQTNIRRVFVDKTVGTGALWVGSNHGASVIKVEPLD